MVHSNGDRVPYHGRRILLTVGQHGANEWHMPNTALSGLSHPDKDTERVVARTPALTLTPGHFCRVVLIANPSGQTSHPDGLGGYENGGPKGQVKVTATYDNGGSSAIIRTIDIPGSNEQYSAQPSGSAGAWVQMRRFRSSLMLPADMTLISNLEAWTGSAVTVTLTVAYIGSPRVIDLVVFEEPLGIAEDLSAGNWIIPLHAGHAGGDLGQLVGSVPKIKKSSTDPGGGAEIICDAAARQMQEFGPILLYVTAFSEGTQNVTDTETSARSVTGTTMTNIWTASTADWVTNRQAWSVSSGANARRVQDSEKTAVLKDNTNVVPVKLWVYARMTTAGPTATYTFKTSLASIGRVPISASTSWGWYSAPAHLACGLGAQDASTLQIYAQTSSGGTTTEWRYIVIEYANL